MKQTCGSQNEVMVKYMHAIEQQVSEGTYRLYGEYIGCYCTLCVYEVIIRCVLKLLYPHFIKV